MSTLEAKEKADERISNYIVSILLMSCIFAIIFVLQISGYKPLKSTYSLICIFLSTIYIQVSVMIDITNSDLSPQKLIRSVFHILTTQLFIVLPILWLLSFLDGLDLASVLFLLTLLLFSMIIVSFVLSGFTGSLYLVYRDDLKLSVAMKESRRYLKKYRFSIFKISMSFFPLFFMSVIFPFVMGYSLAYYHLSINIFIKYTMRGQDEEIKNYNPMAPENLQKTREDGLRKL